MPERVQSSQAEVLSALPAVDVAPPPQRDHVLINLKQVQREKERCEKIDHDNWRLVQRLADVMRTTRVDNRWERPQPAFLNRVGIYQSPRAQSAPCRLCPHVESRWQAGDKMSDDTGLPDESDSAPRNQTCLACHPDTARRKLKQLTLRESKTYGSKDMPSQATDIQDNGALEKPDTGIDKPQTEKPKRRQIRRGKSAPPSRPFHQLVVSYDALRLAVNFPAHASVLLPNGRNLHCKCPTLPPVL